jgi:hypothetical protein
MPRRKEKKGYNNGGKLMHRKKRHSKRGKAIQKKEKEKKGTQQRGQGNT